MKIISVIFGGESVEHDVSILTALQFMNAMDPEKYAPLPVYVAADGAWWTGEALRKREFYPLTNAKAAKLKRITLPLAGLRGKKPYFLSETRGVFKKEQQIPFDLIVPAIHGSHGEDGTLQGLLEFCGVPYAGCGVLGASATMDKAFTKEHLFGLGIPVLDHVMVQKPAEGETVNLDEINADLKSVFGARPYPLIVKPCHLGSSIGVTRAMSAEDVLAGLLLAFRLDYTAIIEPFVGNLVEYNVAVSKAFGEPRTSVIERPVKESEFLDFRDKYLSGDKAGDKMKTGSSEGMASLNRVMNPKELTGKKQKQIRDWALEAFAALDLAGSVRIDFIGDEVTGDLWLNEINTVPGSFAYYLWQESEPGVSFTDLTSAIIEEGFQQSRLKASEFDLTLGGAVIFKKD